MHQRVPGRKARRIVVLVGMPTAGKTKIGKLLAEHLRCDFVDTDDRIVSHFRVGRLQELVDALPPSEFAAAEESVVVHTVAGLSTSTILATGGSVVYSQRAMECLHRAAHVVHLRASLKTIERRVARHPDRGLVLAPGETLADLYRRRMPMYEKWAHREIETNRNRPKVAKRLAALLVEDNIMTLPANV